MIPRLKPRLSWRELHAAAAFWRGGVEAFEDAFAAEMGQQHAIAFPYGRTGLVLLLEALDLRGYEVICPAYTCVVVPHAIVKSGNEPIFVDSAADDFNMALESVPEAITPRARAIVCTSIFGYPVDLDRLAWLCSRYPKLRVIQDCAHSFAAEWRGQPVQRVGEAAIFGLNVSKLMTSVFGGMVTTDDAGLAHRLRVLRDRRLSPASITKSFRRLLYLVAVYPAFNATVYSVVNRLERSGVLDRFVKYYDETLITMPGDYLQQLTDLEARVGSEQIAHYRQIVEERRAIAALYDAALADTPALRLPPRVEGATYSHYVPLVDGDRNALLHATLQRGVQLGQLIEYCIPDMASYRSRPGARGDFPVARTFARSAVNLPLGAGRAGAERTISVVREVLAA